MGNVKVSVIVPFFNAEEYLSETLEALDNQSFSDMEVILVDDGSSDSSPMIAEAFCMKNERFRIVHIQNKGVYNARLEGTKLACGEYIAFCDSDDIPLPDMYAKMHSCALNTDADIVVCGYVREDMQTGHILSKEMISFGNSTYDIPKDAYILPVINTSNWNKLYRKTNLLYAYQFDMPPRILEDMMFHCSIYPFTRRIAFLPDVLYRYRIHTGGAMTYIENSEIEQIRRDMLSVKDYAICNIKNENMLKAIDSMAFIHFGISIPLRQAQWKTKKKQIVAEAKAFLDLHFPKYRSTGYGVIWNLHHKNILIKLLFARWLFVNKTIMAFFLVIYIFMIQKLKIDIKW